MKLKFCFSFKVNKNNNDKLNQKVDSSKSKSSHPHAYSKSSNNVQLDKSILYFTTNFYKDFKQNKFKTIGVVFIWAFCILKIIQLGIYLDRKSQYIENEKINTYSELNNITEDQLMEYVNKKNEKHKKLINYIESNHYFLLKNPLLLLLVLIVST